MKEIFEWKRLLINDLPFEFLLEVLVRTIIMFIAVLLTLRLAGKRGVKQLSIFEVVIIISLGSAAGDPMFYEDVGIVPAIVVFLVILFMYRLVTWLLGKSKKFENFIEGKPHCIIDESKFCIGTFEKEDLAQDEFFAELRLRSVEHLGQVRKAYMETNGDISVFFYGDDSVKPGLPILPELFEQKSKLVTKPGIYACAFCGNTQQLQTSGKCMDCNHEEWVAAITTKRIS